MFERLGDLHAEIARLEHLSEEDQIERYRKEQLLDFITAKCFVEIHRRNLAYYKILLQEKQSEEAQAV